jgi:hypothetical protein
VSPETYACSLPMNTAATGSTFRADKGDYVRRAEDGLAVLPCEPTPTPSS